MEVSGGPALALWHPRLPSLWVQGRQLHPAPERIYQAHQDGLSEHPKAVAVPVLPQTVLGHDGNYLPRLQGPVADVAVRHLRDGSQQERHGGSEIERKYGVAPKTAWFMAHRLREAMKAKGPQFLMVGTIVADETYIGGTPGRMNAKTRARWEGRNVDPEPVVPGSRPNPHTAKTPVVSLIDAQTGEVRCPRYAPQSTARRFAR